MNFSHDFDCTVPCTADPLETKAHKASWSIISGILPLCSYWFAVVAPAAVVVAKCRAEPELDATELP